jgi:hypothetical protein
MSCDASVRVLLSCAGIDGWRERVAGRGAIVPTAPSPQPGMGLDPDDAPLIVRDAGMWDLYVPSWDAPQPGAP